MGMRRHTPLRWLAAAGLAVLVAGCGADTSTPAGSAPPPTSAPSGTAAGQRGEAIEPVTTSEQDWHGVAQALGRPGKLKGGSVYRVSFPRRDLTVTSQGVEIKAGLALGSYASFARYPDGTKVVMGDLVVAEDELPKVTDALHAHGIGQTAVHKHLLDHQPSVWWTHFHAEGPDAARIAQGVRAALDVTATPPPAEPAPQTPIELNTAALDQGMGTQGTNKNGIYTFSFARNETITSHGRVLPTPMGVATAINFQPTGGGQAAINGDFVMTAGEVQKVIETLRAGGIQIVALHNHALDDQPRLFYMHFWAHDDAVDLARTLKKAMGATNVTPSN
jgi:hypothetical protein